MGFSPGGEGNEEKEDQNEMDYHDERNEQGESVDDIALLSLRGGSESERRGNSSGLGGHGRGCLFAYWFTVDRHGLRPRDDKVGEDGFLIRK